MNCKWENLKACYQAEMPLDLPPESAFMYRTSNNMVPLLSGSSVFYPAAFEGDYPSQDVIVVGDEVNNDYVLAGAVTAFRSLSFFTLKKSGFKFKSIVVTQPHIKPGETPEEVIVLRGSDWRELLVQYAECTAKKMNAIKSDTSKNVTGYCTWYYYYADVTEKDFLENVDALIKARGGAYSPEYVQIDDGYQKFQGDWLTLHETWHTPLKETAAKIAANGMVPGIWLMPFLASTASQVYQEHPEWFVKDRSGAVLEMPGWSPPPDHRWVCLDATQEAVRDHLTQVFRTFREWGFKYFKMDGLGFATLDGVFSDPAATPISAFRQGMQTIREAVPDAVLLGCCPPFMGVIGFVDFCRVSPDTSRYWRKPGAPVNCDAAPGAVCIANALHGTQSMWWMYDRYFRADPDTLMARSNNAFYTEGEARMSVLSGILTGIAITSDHLGTIAPDRLALLEKAAKYRLRDARPWKWELDSWAQVFTGTIDGKFGAVIFNDTLTEQTFDLEAIGFTQAEELLHPLGVQGKTITIAPHDGVLLAEK